MAGISKQAVDQYARRQAVLERKVSTMLLEADELREAHPGCGVEKMYYTLNPEFMGRDRFIELMMQLGYRVKRKRNYRRTTYAAAIYYPNLIGGLQVNRPHQVWQSDITYIRVGDRYYYAVFIVDVYTRQIVGYQVSAHMRAEANMKALEMALQGHGPPEIHHSDRGSQYVYSRYVDNLAGLGVKLSMCQCAQDNAYAERINRTIKEEYLDHWKAKNFNELKRFTYKAVKQYNQTRPHNHLSRMSPAEYSDYWNKLPLTKKPVMTIFNYQT
jgi:transposase InsO family protein